MEPWSKGVLNKIISPLLHYSSTPVLMKHRSSIVLACLLGVSHTLAAADNLGILGSKPKWDVLEKYQRTITHDDFGHLINNVYCTHGFVDDLIKIDSDSAQILKNRDAHTFFTLHFATDQGPSSPRRVFDRT